LGGDDGRPASTSLQSLQDHSYLSQQTDDSLSSVILFKHLPGLSSSPDHRQYTMRLSSKLQK
jgi:hypothetical protein